MPFTAEQFFDIFSQYNIAVIPVQIFLNLLAVAAIWTAFKTSQRITFAILAILWAWCGVVYHLIFFTRINPAAYFFGTMFVLQSAIFAAAAFREKRPPTQTRTLLITIVGTIIILYSLILYPLAGYLLGHSYPESPTFGVPCPLTIFTLGVLLLTKGGVPRYVLVIPVVWALIGTSAAILFGVREDLALIVAALLATPLALRR